jgi:hypothetical protein
MTVSVPMPCVRAGRGVIVVGHALMAMHGCGLETFGGSGVATMGPRRALAIGRLVLGTCPIRPSRMLMGGSDMPVRSCGVSPVVASLLRIQDVRVVCLIVSMHLRQPCAS